MITEQHSQALDIRDAFYNRVATDPYFANYKKRKTKMLKVQADQLPYLGIYFLDEIMLPDGDANVGCTRFSHTTRIGFSVINADNDQDAAEQRSDAGYLKIMTLLWTNYDLMNVLHTTNPEAVGIESITRGMRRPVYGSTNEDNETPFVELQYEVSCFYRTEWYPDITDTLDMIDVIVKPNDSESADTIHVVYDLTKDVTPPAITKEKIIDPTTSSVMITWTTDEPATSQIEYGRTSDYGSVTVIDVALVTSHSVLVAGLISNTTYFWRVRTKDAAGNEAVGFNNIWKTL